MLFYLLSLSVVVSLFPFSLSDSPCLPWAVPAIPDVILSLTLVSVRHFPCYSWSTSFPSLPFPTLRTSALLANGSMFSQFISSFFSPLLFCWLEHGGIWVSVEANDKWERCQGCPVTHCAYSVGKSINNTQLWVKHECFVVHLTVKESGGFFKGSALLALISKKSFKEEKASSR